MKGKDKIRVYALRHTMASIKKGTLEAILLAAKNTSPDEFLALLSSKGKNNVIDEYVLLPSTYGKTFSSIRLDLAPYDSSVRGSVHSHPYGRPMPSRADLRAFRAMGEINLIIASPFNVDSFKAFNKAGKEIKIKVIE